ncbi:MAG: hypothetical protein AAGD04_01995 [Pseudomonadota bacterium]
MNTWQEQIPGCMAATTAPFGIHPKDKKRAQEAIASAKSNGATFDDFAKELVWYCYNQNMLLEYTQKAVASARNMW